MNRFDRPTEVYWENYRVTKITFYIVLYLNILNFKYLIKMYMMV